MDQRDKLTLWSSYGLLVKDLVYYVDNSFIWGIAIYVYICSCESINSIQPILAIITTY